jgi:hypothetical protein
MLTGNPASRQRFRSHECADGAVHCPPRQRATHCHAADSAARTGPKRSSAGAAGGHCSRFQALPRAYEKVGEACGDGGEGAAGRAHQEGGAYAGEPPRCCCLEVASCCNRCFFFFFLDSHHAQMIKTQLRSVFKEIIFLPLKNCRTREHELCVCMRLRLRRA